MMADRPIPLVGDIALDAVQTITHRLDAGFAPLRIGGLDGEVQQRFGRPSHLISIEGLLIGESARESLNLPALSASPPRFHTTKRKRKVSEINPIFCS